MKRINLLFIAFMTCWNGISQKIPEDIDILYKDMNQLRDKVEILNDNIQASSNYLLKSERMSYYGLFFLGVTAVTGTMMWQNGYDGVPIVLGIGGGLGTGFTIASSVFRIKGYKVLNKGF